MKTACIALGTILFSPAVLAQQEGPVAPGQIYQQAERRQQQISRNAERKGFATLDYQAAQEKLPTLPSDTASACTPYKTLRLQSVEKKFGRYLEEAAARQGLKPLPQDPSAYKKAAGCIRTVDIIALSKAAQNRLIEDGWITGRVLLEVQDKAQDALKIIILPGKIVQVEEEKSVPLRTPGLFRQLQGRPPNLREIEQLLDNVQRLGGLDAQIDIAPAEKAGDSKLVVNWRKTARPYRFSFLLDDSGSKALGKYLGTLNVNLDNPLNLADSFTASYTHTLKPGARMTDNQGKRHRSLTDNYYLHYAIAHRNWLLSIDASRYHYDQIIAGYARVYHYKGNSHKYGINLSDTIYRDQNKKTVIDLGIWWRDNRNYINEAEIAVQRRQTAGWKLGIKQTIILPRGVFNGGLHYQKGTRMLGAKEVPEEAYHEGSAKAAIWRLDGDWYMPLSANTAWQSGFHLQYAPGRLISLDLVNLGGRNTVRGFGENKSIAGDSGWYWQNSLNWQYRPGQHAYLGADIGGVWGKSSAYLQGKTIAGAVAGIKGSLEYHGNWQYNLFAGKALKKPRNWKNNDKWLIGFSGGYYWQ